MTLPCIQTSVDILERSWKLYEVILPLHKFDQRKKQVNQKILSNFFMSSTLKMRKF